MELFDYLRFRGKLFGTLLVLGLVAIVLLGQRSGGDTFEARTELLVRPSSSSLVGAGADIDRYIETEMTLLLTPTGLNEMADATGVDRSRLARLTYTHQDESEILTLRLSGADPEETVRSLNEVASAYLDGAAERNAAPARREVEFVDERIDATRDRLDAAASTIQANSDAFAQANPDRNIPGPEILSPAAASDRALLSSRLERLYQQQADAQLELQDTGDSQVLDPARGASTTPGWGRVTYLAALVGLCLLLLAGAGVGLALSRRVLGRSRWDQITSPLHLRRPVVLAWLTPSARRRTVDRTTRALRAGDETDGAIFVVRMPGSTSRLSRRAAGLVDGLEATGRRPVDLESLADLPRGSRRSSSPEHPDPAAPVLLLVDTSACRVDEVIGLGDYPESVQRRIVPVLV